MKPFHVFVAAGEHTHSKQRPIVQFDAWHKIGTSLLFRFPDSVHRLVAMCTLSMTPNHRVETPSAHRCAFGF